MQWSPKQDQALCEVSTWLNDPLAPQVYHLFGYAGTGKTTLAKHLAGGVEGLTCFAAYTGKAASVLRRSGCTDASTIHSLLYDVRPQSRLRLMEIEVALKQPNLDEYSRQELTREKASENRRVKRPRFSVNPDSILRETKLLVLDECSMVNEWMARDIESFHCKILVLGDPAQLPPIKGSGHYTNVKPEILLDEIHRQALDSPIIRWSKLVREGQSLPVGVDGAVKRVPRKAITSDVMVAFDQILTGKNSTRRSINKAIRDKKGFSDSKYPVNGERLVILRNEKEYGVLNGVTCQTASDTKDDPEDAEAIYCNVEYEGQTIPNLPLCRSQFDAYADADRADDIDFNKRWLVPADYGYALTVHKSQGSQWSNVMVYDDGFAKREAQTRRKWLYTAVTRAQDSLTIAF